MRNPTKWELFAALAADMGTPRSEVSIPRSGSIKPVRMIVTGIVRESGASGMFNVTGLVEGKTEVFFVSTVD